MGKQEHYIPFWKDYIDYALSHGTTLWQEKDRGKGVAKHSKTKTIRKLTIDLNANEESGNENIYAIRVENYINKGSKELNQKIFDVLKSHEIEIRTQLNKKGWDIIFHETTNNSDVRKIYIPGKDLKYNFKSDTRLFDFYHRASEDLYEVLRPIYDSMSFL